MDKRIEKETLALVPLGPKYEQFYIELANNPAVRERVNLFIPFLKEHYTDLVQRQQHSKNHFVWIIEDNGAPAGVITFAALRNAPQIYQGGYWLLPAFWGKGLATRALGMVADYLMLSCDAKRVQALVEPNNVASMRVLEKCGFRNEGLLRSYFPTKTGKLLDVQMYALTLAG